jgi:hypothetical protein
MNNKIKLPIKTNQCIENIESSEKILKVALIFIIFTIHISNKSLSNNSPKKSHTKEEHHELSNLF